MHPRIQNPEVTQHAIEVYSSLIAFQAAKYESAWRDSVAAVEALGRENAADRMEFASKVANENVDALAEVIGLPAALAIQAALIVAAANTHGDRPDEHMNQRSPLDAHRFVADYVRESL